VKLNAANPEVYKTPCHKPEMAIALTPFKAMLGFRPLAELHANLNNYPEIAEILGSESVKKVKECYERTKGVGDFDNGVREAVKGVFSSYMRNFDTGGGKEMLEKVIDRIKAKVVKSDLDSLILSFSVQFPSDCGVLSPIFLNVVALSPGESIFVSSNTPHAYVEGEIIECMARSDNVIRCGLTPKFKDVEVLCSSLTYDTFKPEVGMGIELGGGTRRYRPPVEDFEVRVTEFEDGKGGKVDDGVDSGSILLVISGSGTLTCQGGESCDVKFGDSVFVSAMTELSVKEGGEGIKFVRGMRNVG